MPAIRLAAALATSLLFAVPAAAQPAQVTVKVWSFGFAPQPLALAAGQPVTLTFVNQSGGGHDFTAPGFFQHARIVAGSAPGGVVALKGHESRSVTLIPAAGSYQAHCGHFLHKQMGMSDQIFVR